MADVGWYFDERFVGHETGAGHPERAERMGALVEGLRGAGLVERMRRMTFEAAGRAVAESVHDGGYVASVERAWGEGLRRLDADTVISERSYETAMLVLGAAVGAVDAVMGGEVERAFVTGRPPGHHAERDRSMGFCLFNNVAAGAERAVRKWGCGRVAVVDFDVHHGNGTQHIFEKRADVLFVSIHQDPASLYPGTGYAGEVGKGAGEGFTVNVPMAAGSGDAEYLREFDRVIVPRLVAYGPEVVLVSAGFDGAREDPLAGIELSEAGFAGMTGRLVSAAERCCGGRIVSVLEGGYDLGALGRCAAAHVSGLLGG